MSEVVGTSVLPTEEVLKQNITEEEIQREIKEEATKKLLKKAVGNVFLDAFSAVEKNEMRVSDIVMNSLSYSYLRKYLKDQIDPYTSKEEIGRGLMATLWGAFVWVRKEVNETISCYQENSEELGKCFLDIVKAKQVLKLED